jgi:2-polyprenyl-3-methyl-5-hydroxy-6-metoxy-1,4-benzoquinol methylase
MLRASLDYFILRSLAHSRKLATEEQLDARYSQVSAKSLLEEEMPKFRKLIGRFEGHLPVDPGLRYLDMGCGTGELTIAFAKLEVRRITGVDFLPRYIERARAYTRKLDMEQGVQFICRDLHEWVPEEKFDVLFSFDAFEHIDDPAFPRMTTDCVAPGGIAVLAFGPFRRTATICGISTGCKFLGAAFSSPSKPCSASERNVSALAM